MHDDVATVAVNRERARVYEHGWQSWSPTTAYRLDERPFRPVSDLRRVGNYRPERTAPDGAFWGEGLLAVDPGTGEGLQVFAAPSGAGEIPSIRADVDGDTVVVRADGETTSVVVDAPLDTALARWGDGFAAAAGVGPLRPPPTAWCSWYHYFERVTQDDIEENLRAIDELRLDIDVVQIDDGYQAEIGDWLLLSDRFASLEDVVGRIRGAGRRAGIWVAPFLVGERSVLAREHPDWLVRDAEPGNGMGGPAARLPGRDPSGCRGLSARGLRHASASLGIDYFKIDFVYAGAMDGGRADGGVRRRGLPARAACDPRGHRTGRLPPRLRSSDPAERRSGRRHARRSRHRATTSSRSTAISPSPPSGRRRRTPGRGPGSTAGSG